MRPSLSQGRFVLRYGCSVIATVMFLVMWFIYKSSYPLYMHLLWPYSFLVWPKPFLDLSGVLSAIDCSREGVDVFVTNPCDSLGRVHNYSPLWLAGRFLPVTDGWRMPLGVITDLCFISSLSLLPPPETSAALKIRIAATLSMPVVYAVERANVDIYIFMLLLAGGLLASRNGRVCRMLGYCALLIAGLLKYYPLATLLTISRERPGYAISCGMVVLCGLGGLFWFWQGDIINSFSSIPHGLYFSDQFGKSNLPHGLAIIFSPTNSALQGILSSIFLAICFILLVIVVRKILHEHNLHLRFLHLTELERLLMFIGSLTIVGCFISGQSLYYRCVSILLILPGIVKLCQKSSNLDRDIMLKCTVPMLMFLLWSEPLRQTVTLSRSFDPMFESVTYQYFWLFREWVWWCTIAVLISIICYLVEESRTFTALKPAFKFFLPKAAKRNDTQPDNA